MTGGVASALHCQRAAHTYLIGCPVTPCQFADLAAAIALHSEELSTAGGPDAATLHRVWKQTLKCFAAWREELKQSPSPSLYAEAFAAELPIRVWCAAVAENGEPGDNRGAAVASKINRELLAFRCVMLQALAADLGLSTSEAAAIDRFRRRCERWCDVLLGPIAARTGAAECAFRPERATEFGRNFTAEPGGLAAWQLVMAGLRVAFAEADSYRSVRKVQHDDRAAELAGVLFASFPRGAFASSGNLLDPQLSRLTRVPRETAPKKIETRNYTSPVAKPTHESPPLAAPAPHTQQSISFSRLRKRTPKQ